MINKNKMILKKKVIILCSTLLISTLANAQTVVSQDTTTLPALIVNNYDDATLSSQNCDPNVMRTLNNNYLQSRTIGRNAQLQTLVQAQVNTTPASVSSSANGSCYEKAAGDINSALSTLDTIKKLFSGDFSGVSNGIKNASNGTKNPLCEQINNYTGAITSSQITKYNNGVDTVTNQVNTSTGVNLNNYTATSTYNTSNTLGGTVTSANCSINNITSCNPFK